MEALKVARLIEALALVGQVYRSKDGAQPAEPVRKILAQLDGADHMTLAEWAESKRTKARATAGKRAGSGPKAAMTADLAHILHELEGAETQSALRDAVAKLRLSASEWKALAREVTGQAAKSGKAARELVEAHLSDRLLLDERVESVKRQFRPAIS